VWEGSPIFNSDFSVRHPHKEKTSKTVNDRGDWGFSTSRFGLDLELAVSGGGNYRDRAKPPSKLNQERREDVAVPFRSIGSRGSPVSTLSVRPMTSLGTVGGSSWTTARTS